MSVAIVGAGIAGLTAALRLSQRGYRVTLYEETPFLGGSLAAQPVNGVYHDAYSHMFSGWYRNFWALAEHDLHLHREGKEASFEARSSLKVLRKGAKSYLQLTNVGSFQYAWANLWSGVESPPDMLAWTYSMLDLLANPLYRRQLLGEYSVNGFVQSRRYATERSAFLHDLFLMFVWAVHSDITAASSYREFIKYSFRHPAPLTWFLKGNLYTKLMKPLEDKLRELGCEIKTCTSVRRVVDDGKRIRSVLVQQMDFPDQHGGRPVQWTEREEPVDQLILALPPRALQRLIETTDGQSIVDRLPALSQVRRLHSEPIPVLDLYFKRKLEGIPKDPVALCESGYDLAFIDLSQLWTDDPNMIGVTALGIAASDAYALPLRGREEVAYTIIKELHSYIGNFNPGEKWGDPTSDIDWQKSYFDPNEADQIFSNLVGSWEWRPEASYPEIPNLFFAGDVCKTAIDMTCVESAVMSGLNAAKALWESLDPAERRGDPIEVLLPDAYPEVSVLAMKLALAPYAYGAKLWSTAVDALPDLAQGRLPADYASHMASLIALPYAYTGDWWTTAYSLCDRLLGGGGGT